MGNDCGINEKTVRAWISVLEASYIVFLLYPYYRNLGRRLVKSPKLYFVDTGLACSFLHINSEEQLINHPLRGSLIETFLISDLLKQQYNLERMPSLYFWRDHSGHEVDCIIEQSLEPVAVEIKASKTVIPSFFKEINFWRDVTNFKKFPGYIIYGGSENQRWQENRVISWKSAGTLIRNIEQY